MARYIDADLLLDRLNKKKSEIAKGRYTEGFNDAIMRVRSMVSSSTTADVVPKSEVEKIFEEIEKTIKAALILVDLSHKHNQKEIQCKKECYEDFLGYTAGLKKKYMEDKNATDQTSNI